jgi:hypothetical protein
VGTIEHQTKEEPMTETKPAALDLDAIEARVEATPKGPWHVEYFGDHDYPQRIGNDAAILVAETYEGGEGIRPTPEFIAAARTDVPNLIAEVKRLRAALAKLESEVSWLGDDARADLTLGAVDIDELSGRES